MSHHPHPHPCTQEDVANEQSSAYFPGGDVITGRYEDVMRVAVARSGIRQRDMTPVGVTHSQHHERDHDCAVDEHEVVDPNTGKPIEGEIGDLLRSSMKKASAQMRADAAIEKEKDDKARNDWADARTEQALLRNIVPNICNLAPNIGTVTAAIRLALDAQRGPIPSATDHDKMSPAFQIMLNEISAMTGTSVSTLKDVYDQLQHDNPKCENCWVNHPQRLATTPLSQLRRCLGCNGVRYCSKECQKEHWKVHRPLCQKVRGERLPESYSNCDV